MAIIAITGIPGSGKSYWMAYQLMFGGYADKYTVFHNVDGLQPRYFGGHVEDWREICPQERAAELFAKDEQIAFDRMKRAEYFDKPLLWILDEAGQYLNKEDAGIYAWLSWHRHLGQDIWIGVQDIRRLHRSYRGLIEIEVRANKSRVIDHFVYSHKAGNVTYRTEKLKRQKVVYDCYRSFDATGNSAKRSKLVPAFICMGLLSVCLMAYSAYAMTTMFGRPPDKSVKVSDKKMSVSGEKKGVRKLVDKENIPVGVYTQGAYTYAGCIGNSIKIQTADGRLRDLGEEIGPYHVLERNSKGAVFMYRNTVQHIYRRSGYVEVKEQASAAGGVGATARRARPVSD